MRLGRQLTLFGQSDSRKHELLKKFGASKSQLRVSWVDGIYQANTSLLQSSWGHFEVPLSLLLSVIFLCCHFRYEVPPLLLVPANTSYVIYTSLHYFSSIIVFIIDISRHGRHHCSHCSPTQPEVAASTTRQHGSSDSVSAEPQPPLQQTRPHPGQHPFSSSEPRLQWGGSSQPPVYPR